MGLTTRQRWMLYGLAGLLTVAAMVAVGPDAADEAAATVAPVSRQPRPVMGAHGAASVSGSAPALALVPLPARPFSAAGRSPFDEERLAPPPAVAADAAAVAAAQAAAAAAPRQPVAVTAPALPFGFLGRWQEGGVSTVFVSHGGRGLPAVVGRPLTPHYLVERIDAREMQLRHIPTGTRQTLALVAQGAAAAAASQASGARDESEEQN